MLDLLGGDADRLADAGAAGRRRISGIARVFVSTGQVYPRSLDYDVVTALAQVAAAPSNVATSIRLMAGHELVTEGFRPGQVGSSAMPHKMNTRSCERVNGLAVIIRGYVSMVGELAGDQWNEGDVSCSVVRRVALPDAFFALDGLFETFLTVLDDFGAFPAVIEAELRRYLPFLATTKVLMAAVRHGRRAGDRARGDQGARRRGGPGDAGVRRADNDLLDRLAADPGSGVSPGRARRRHRRSRWSSPARPAPRWPPSSPRIEKLAAAHPRGGRVPRLPGWCSSRIQPMAVAAGRGACDCSNRDRSRHWVRAVSGTLAAEAGRELSPSADFADERWRDLGSAIRAIGSSPI